MLIKAAKKYYLFAQEEEKDKSYLLFTVPRKPEMLILFLSP